MDEKQGEKTGNWDPDEPQRRAVTEKKKNRWLLLFLSIGSIPQQMGDNFI